MQGVLQNINSVFISKQMANNGEMEDSAASSFLFKTAVTLRINYTVQ
jgi:hypothetical protein